MPGKLILFLIMIVIVTIFAGFNTTNVCNVSLVFHEFENVPVFVTVLFSFVIGILVMLPFAFRKKQPKQNTSVCENQQKTVQRAFGGGSNPLHPGVPVGDALPFMLLLTGMYVYIRNKK